VLRKMVAAQACRMVAEVGASVSTKEVGVGVVSSRA
jgi:hypothetical protein